LPIVLRVGRYVDFQETLEPLGDVGTSLRTGLVDAVDIVERDLLVGADVGGFGEDSLEGVSGEETTA